MPRAIVLYVARRAKGQTDGNEPYLSEAQDEDSACDYTLGTLDF